MGCLGFPLVDSFGERCCSARLVLGFVGGSTPMLIRILIFNSRADCSLTSKVFVYLLRSNI